MRTVLIIEDHPITAMVTEEILSSVVQGRQVVQVDCMNALSGVDPMEVEVVISDLMLPDSQPKDLLDMVSSRYSTAKRIFFTSIDDPSMVSNIESSGALYISKNAKYKDILSKIQGFLQVGSINVDVAETRNGYQSLIQMPGTSKPLTIKQAQVMEHLAAGKTAKEIGRALGISPDTVKAHMKEAITRLGVITRTEAVSNYNTARKIAERIYGEAMIQESLQGGV